MATVLQRDLVAVLRRLRDARTAGDEPESAVCERRLNELLDRMIDAMPDSQKLDYHNAKSDY